jgi:hypothetical protein
LRSDNVQLLSCEEIPVLGGSPVPLSLEGFGDSAWVTARLFLRQQRERLLLESLMDYTAGQDRQTLKILDFGAITGDLLPMLYQSGFPAQNLQAYGLIKHTLDDLNHRYPMFQVDSLRPTRLPEPDASVDVIMAFSLFSRVFDPEIREHFAGEITRLLAPNGLLLWYDMKPVYDLQREWQRRLTRWVSPRDEEGLPRMTSGTPLATNPKSDLFPVDPVGLQALFPECRLEALMHTGLYPPMARQLAANMPRFLEPASRLGILKTHHYAVLRKDPALADG